MSLTSFAIRESCQDEPFALLPSTRVTTIYMPSAKHKAVILLALSYDPYLHNVGTNTFHMPVGGKNLPFKNEGGSVMF